MFTYFGAVTETSWSRCSLSVENGDYVFFTRQFETPRRFESPGFINGGVKYCYAVSGPTLLNLNKLESAYIEVISFGEAEDGGTVLRCISTSTQPAQPNNSIKYISLQCFMTSRSYAYVMENFLGAQKMEINCQEVVDSEIVTKYINASIAWTSQR